MTSKMPSKINRLRLNEHYKKEIELMRKQLDAKDEVNRMFANEISNLRLQFEDSRKHVSAVHPSKEGC